MNEHLEPIFELILPTLKSLNIKYWVYGGVGIASVHGKFFRINKDVDIFILNEDLGFAKSTLENVVNRNNWKIYYSSNNRPKLELFIKGKERFSVVPVYRSNSQIIFKFGKRTNVFPPTILTQEKREINNVEFLTPTNDFVKVLFIAYMENRKDLRSRQRLDAENILSKEEFKKYYGES